MKWLPCQSSQQRWSQYWLPSTYMVPVGSGWYQWCPWPMDPKLKTYYEHLPVFCLGVHLTVKKNLGLKSDGTNGGVFPQTAQHGAWQNLVFMLAILEPRKANYAFFRIHFAETTHVNKHEWLVLKKLWIETGLKLEALPSKNMYIRIADALVMMYTVYYVCRTYT